jgi:hypothetical protein
MESKHVCAVNLLLLFLFATSLIPLYGQSASYQPIVLAPRIFSPGTRVKVTLRLLILPGMKPPSVITGGVDNKMLLRANYTLAPGIKKRTPAFTWTARPGRHRIWFKVQRQNQVKSQQFYRYIYVASMFKSLKIKKKRPVFHLKAKYRTQLRGVARMMLNRVSDKMIKRQMRALHRAYHSETRGAGHQADEEALKALQEQVQKEMWESEREKNEQQQQAQREHIKRLMELIRELMKIWTDSLNNSQSILQTC